MKIFRKIQSASPFIKGLVGTHAVGRHNGLLGWGDWRQGVSYLSQALAEIPSELWRTRQSHGLGSSAPGASPAQQADLLSVLSVQGGLQMHLPGPSLLPPAPQCKWKACLGQRWCESSVEDMVLQETLNRMEIEWRAKNNFVQLEHVTNRLGLDLFWMDASQKVSHLCTKREKHVVTEFLMTKNLEGLSWLPVVCGSFRPEQSDPFCHGRPGDVCP